MDYRGGKGEFFSFNPLVIKGVSRWVDGNGAQILGYVVWREDERVGLGRD